MTRNQIRHPIHEHSVPWFWPMAAAIKLEANGLELFLANMRFIKEAAKIAAPPEPGRATPNRVILDLDTMRLRDFPTDLDGAEQTPVLIDVPDAGHPSTIADYSKGQSLIETLVASGLSPVLVTDWKSATPQMCDHDIDKYLTDIDAAITALGGRVHLVGLCQGVTRLISRVHRARS